MQSVPDMTPTPPTPLLPPDAPSDWEELARVTAEAIATEAEYEATTVVANALKAIAARKRFTDFATPERIARLLAVAQRSTEELAAYKDELTAANHVIATLERARADARLLQDNLSNAEQQFGAARTTSPVPEQPDEC